MADRQIRRDGGAGADRLGPVVARPVHRRLLDPVAVILVLAGVFDGIAGNGIHALVLVGAGIGIVVRPPRPSPDRRRVHIGTRSRPWWHLALPVSVAFGIVAGALQRYTWPVTFAVIVPGVVALVVAGRQPLPERDDPDTRRTGVALWLGVLLAIASFELVVFLLSSGYPPWPTPEPSPYPTLSRLFNEVVVGHVRQAIALTLWLVGGWWLVERGER